MDLVIALRSTATRLAAGSTYQWGHLGMCNCGQLAQTITQRSKREIHEAALALGGEWRDRARDYCPTSGLPIDGIIRELLDCGLSPTDLADLEYLADDRVLRRLDPARELQRNRREDVIDYLQAWAGLLDDELGQREATAAAAA